MTQMYGGDSQCLRCGTFGGVHHVVESDGDVERKTRALAEVLKPYCADDGAMLGVMRADAAWVVTLSNAAAIGWDFVRTVMEFDPNLSPIAHDWSTIPQRTLGGYDIRSLLTSVDDHGPPGVMFKLHAPPRRGGREYVSLAGGTGCVCAAPKLISYFTQDAGAASLPPTNVHMVEMWCGAPRGRWVHGQIAGSCAHCRLILPTLLCRNPARAASPG